MSELGLALSMEQISKRFPGTLAVDGVDFSVYAGEVHALIGENGAGKSTLMKILAGSFNDYAGTIRINDRPVDLHTPAAAKAYGIQMIHQELSLAPPLSLAENLLAGRLPRRWGFVLDRKAMRAESRRWLERVGLDLDGDTIVEDISQHEAQLVEIAKALANHPCILVMDEPTSALSRQEVQRLFEIIRRLRRQGLAIVYISHHLDEVLEIADRVTVLRDGRKVATHEIRDVSASQLVELMVGRNVSALYAERTTRPAEVRLEVRRASRYGFFHDVSFAVRGGEILGVGGLSGSGRSELARSLCGIDPLDEGAVLLDGRDITPADYRQSISAGMVYLSEDRKSQGLALRMSVAENVLSSVIPGQSCAGFYSARGGRSLVRPLVGTLEIHPADPARMTSTLSGGNQQKALLAKWLATKPEVLILDEPTRGVDVAAKVVIHQAIAALADAGKCVLLISSDLPELVGLSDRVMILRQGKRIGQIDREQCSEATVLLAANGEGEFVQP